MLNFRFYRAVRFCGMTFGYTAISILLNYSTFPYYYSHGYCSEILLTNVRYTVTPPAAVGLANGIAQSIVSLARCIGPILGGFLWSVSTEGNPQGYPLGFIVCTGMCVAAILQSFLIR